MSKSKSHPQRGGVVEGLNRTLSEQRFVFGSLHSSLPDVFQKHTQQLEILFSYSNFGRMLCLFSASLKREVRTLWIKAFDKQIS